jgi:transcription elongation GreA/GreB family factor
VTAQPEGEDVVRPGCRVSYREADGKVQAVRIRIEGEPTQNGLHPDTPLGRALLGHRVGDQVEIDLHPVLPKRRLTIEAIE